jgi:hypothetical protein
MEKVREYVDKILVLKPFLKLLAEGRIFKLGFSWFLRIFAALFAIGFIVEWIGMWKNVFKMSGSMVLVLTIVMVLAVAAAFALINLILIKADEIAALPETKDYIVIPISVVFLKLIGEVLFLIWGFFGLAGFLLALTKTGGVVLKMIPFYGGSGFFGGLTGFVISLIIGFFSFFLCYLLAENGGVLADIARNTKK